MRLRDLWNQRAPATAPAPPEAEQGELDRMRSVGEDLLAAGDAAIARALSGDSEAFLRANRQQGGQ